MSRFCFVRERLVVAVSQRFDKNHLAVLCVTEPQWGMWEKQSVSFQRETSFTSHPPELWFHGNACKMASGPKDFRIFVTIKPWVMTLLMASQKFVIRGEVYL